MTFPSKILVPVDFSACSTAALDHAIQLAGALGATVHLLHVMPPGRGTDPAAKIAAPVEAADVAARNLRELIDRARPALGDRVRGELREGNPERLVPTIAAEGKHDLIAMGTHGRTGRLHMLAGSVAEAVIRNAPCPVLVVRVRD